MKLKHLLILVSLLLAASCGKEDRNKVIVNEGETASASVSAAALTKDRYVLYEANPKCLSLIHI